MKFNNPRWSLTIISGSLVILFYCVFTFTSWVFYPEVYGPLTHYLSRLGNFNFSPFGAYFYNLGCILTGIALIPFFLSLRVWYTKQKSQIFVLGVGQILGICSAVSLMMIGVYSEDQGAPHRTASSTFFLLNFFVLIIVSLALLWHPAFFKPVAIYAFSIDILSLVLEFSLGDPIVEWFTVFGSLLFVALLSMNTRTLTEPDVVEE